MRIGWDIRDNSSDDERVLGTRSPLGYRCYLMDVSGNFLDAVDLESMTDAEAIREALKTKERQKYCHGIQVWKGLRMVYQQGRVNLIKN